MLVVASDRAADVTTFLCDALTRDRAVIYCNFGVADNHAALRQAGFTLTAFQGLNNQQDKRSPPRARTNE